MISLNYISLCAIYIQVNVGGVKGGGWLTVGECFDWVLFFNNGGG